MPDFLAAAHAPFIPAISPSAEGDDRAPWPADLRIASMPTRELRLPRLAWLPGHLASPAASLSSADSLTSCSSGYRSDDQPPSPELAIPPAHALLAPRPAGLSRIRTNPRAWPTASMSPVIARPAPASKDPDPKLQGAAQEPQVEDLRALLDALFGSFERCLNDAGAAGATGAVGPKAPACPGAAVVDDLCRWAFFPESDELSLRRSYGRLTVALAIQTTEGRHVAKGLTIKDSLGDGVPMLMELPPPELLARTRAVREGLSLVLRIDNDRVQDPVAFSDSLRAFAKTTIVVGGTRYGRLPAGAAAAQVHRLDLSSLADDGADLRRCARELGKDLQVMRRLRVVRVPESWSGDWDFKQVCRRAGVDIEWVDAAGLAVGKTCHRGPRQTAVRLLRSCLS